MCTGGDIDLRLAKIEKENRRLKRLIIAASLFSSVSVIALIGSAVRSAVAQTSKPGLQTITAYEYVLRDSEGRMRASLAFSDVSGSPSLTFFDAEGRTRLQMWADENSTSIVTHSPNGAGYQTKSTAFLEGAIVKASKSYRWMSEGSASMSAFKGAGTQIMVEDSEGFTTQIGNMNIGEARREKEKWTNSASIVMFKRAGQVIWQAPPEK